MLGLIGGGSRRPGGFLSRALRVLPRFISLLPTAGGNRRGCGWEQGRLSEPDELTEQDQRLWRAGVRLSQVPWESEWTPTWLAPGPARHAKCSDRAGEHTQSCALAVLQALRQPLPHRGAGGTPIGRHNLPAPFLQHLSQGLPVHPAPWAWPGAVLPATLLARPSTLGIEGGRLPQPVTLPCGPFCFT